MCIIDYLQFLSLITMSRFLILNLEDFDLNQDITKTIQPFNPFCICCLDREGPMVNLEKCDHSQYLAAFERPQLKRFNQLVCHNCHTILKKIKSFRAQVLESFDILVSGNFTNATINHKRMYNLLKQTIVKNLNLPTDLSEDKPTNDEFETNEDYCDAVQRKESMQQNLISELSYEPNMEHTFMNKESLIAEKNSIHKHSDSNIENFSCKIQDDPNMEHQFMEEIHNNQNVEQNYDNKLQDNSNIKHNLVDEINYGAIVVQKYPRHTENDCITKENYTNLLQSGKTIVQNIAYEIDDDANLEHFIQETPNDSNMEQDYTDELQDGLNMERKFTSEINYGSNMERNFTNEIDVGSNMEQKFTNEINDGSNMERNFTNEIDDGVNKNEKDNVVQIQNRKNIKTALEILERNNQSFVSLGSQLQFLNGGYLSFLEPSLLSKEILTDISLIPSKSSTDLENGLLNNSKSLPSTDLENGLLNSSKSLANTDLDNGLLNNSKSLEIEIDGTDKMFYDSLGLSPELMAKESSTSDVNKVKSSTSINKIEEMGESKLKMKTLRPKRKRISTKSYHENLIRLVKLTHGDLDKERVIRAQSQRYLKYKFRCETCIVSFSYKDNLDDHIKRKHGPIKENNVICDICFQVIPHAGHVTEHNYRHYTRYECVRCVKRWYTLDEATQHCVNKHARGDTLST